MTGHAILLPVDNDFFNLSLPEKMSTLDKKLTESIINLNNPKDLHPFPILGMPDWHPDNNNAEFYKNTSYFRPKNR